MILKLVCICEFRSKDYMTQVKSLGNTFGELLSSRHYVGGEIGEREPHSTWRERWKGRPTRQRCSNEYIGFLSTGRTEQLPLAILASELNAQARMQDAVIVGWSLQNDGSAKGTITNDQMPQPRCAAPAVPRVAAWQRGMPYVLGHS